MPDQSANYAALDSGYRIRAYLSLMTGDSVLVGTVSATPSDPVLNVAYTVTSGSASDVRSGMRVVVRSSGGAFKGTLSVRYSGTISTTNLPVREFSSGDVQVVSGDVFTVYSDLLPSDKLVSADETFSPDSTTYVDQNADPPPLVTSGGWWAGWVTNSPVPFYGVDSVTVDADSVSGVTHAWAASGGTLSAASGDSTALTVTTAGKYIVTHTGTDPDNSKSAAQRIPVRAHDASDPPLDIFLNSLDGDEATGFRTSFELMDAGTLDDIPDLAPVIIWADEWHGDTNASYGAAVAGRGHIICAGYLRRDSTSLDADDETLTFEVVSPIALLEEIAGFSKYFAQASSPASWQEIAGLSVWRAIIQILRHYTNYLDLFDLVFVSILNRDYPNFPIQKSNPVAQIRELADAIDCRFVEADRTGRMEVQRILDFTPLDERGTPATTLTLTKDRFIECEVTREHFAPLETYRLRGFIKGYTDNTPVFARFPASPGRGTVSGTVEKIIADDQADALERCALRGAQANRVFFDADGVKHHAPTARLRLFGNYAQALGFHREWIAFSGYTTVRGIDLSDYRWNVVSVSVRYDGDEDATTEVELRAETHAPASGAVDDTPETEIVIPTEPPVVRPPVVTVPPVVRIPEWTDELPIKMFILSYSETKAAKATSFTSGGTITWTDISTGLSGTGIWARSDPYNYFRRFALTTNGLYVCDDIWAASPSWSQRATNTAMFGDSARRGYKLLMSHMVKGWIMALSGDTGAAVSFDYGYTWSQVSIKGGAASWGTSVARGGDTEICGHDANHLYSLVQAADSRFHDVYKSSDGGLTWSATGGTVHNGGGSISPMCLHIPYRKPGGADNDDDGSMYVYTTAHSSGPQAALQQSTNGGVTFGVQISGAGSYDPAHSAIGNPFNAFTHDANYWWFAVVQDSTSNALIARTTNKFTSWATSNGFSGAGYYTALVNGWSMSPDAAVIWSTAQRISITTDGGASWFGNLPSGWADGVAYVEFDLSDFISARS